MKEDSINRKVHFEELDHDRELNIGADAFGAWFQIGNQKFHIANSAEGESAEWWRNQLWTAFEKLTLTPEQILDNERLEKIRNEHN